NMFFGCINLVEVGELSISGIADIQRIFYNCFNLLHVPVLNWDTSSLITSNLAFYNCLSLTDLQAQNWDIENVNNFTNFATGVTIPTATYDQILTNWSAQNVNPSLAISF